MKTQIFVLSAVTLFSLSLGVKAETMTVQPAYLSQQNKGNAIEAYYTDSADNVLLTFSPVMKKVIKTKCTSRAGNIPCKIKGDIIWERVAEPNVKYRNRITIKGIIKRVHKVDYAD